MKKSVTGTVFILFAIVLVAYWKLAPQQSSEKSSPEASSPRVMRLLPADIEGAIELIQIQKTASGEVITLKKQKDGWWLAYPVSAPADPLIAGGLATALKVSNKARRLTPEKGWEEYGLEQPSLKIGIETSKGKERRFLFFGDKSPIGNFIFAKWDGEPDYFLVGGDLRSAFERSVYSLRRKQIFQTPVNEISRLTIKTADEKYDLAVRDGKWIWMEPLAQLGKPVAKKETDELLAKVKDLNIKDFLDKEKPTRDRGFSLSSSFLKVYGKDGSAETLLIGKEVAVKDGFYGVMEKQKNLFLIATTNIRLIFEAVQIMGEGIEHKNTSAQGTS